MQMKRGRSSKSEMVMIGVQLAPSQSSHFCNASEDRTPPNVYVDVPDNSGCGARCRPETLAAAL